MYNSLPNKPIMDSEISYIAQSKMNPYMGKISTFLSNEKFITEKGNPLTNIVNQAKGETFHIPFRYTNEKKIKEEITLDEINELSIDDFDDESDKVTGIPIDSLMGILEECRRNHLVLNISEAQYFSIPNQVKTNDENGIDLEDVSNNKNQDLIKIVKSGIDLDFDIYERDNTRINDEQYSSIVRAVVNILMDSLDIKSCPDVDDLTVTDSQGKRFEYYCAVLRKPEVVGVKHADYGNCFKESFRIRIPGIKITKEYKKFFINTINEKAYTLSDSLNGINIFGPWDKILDTGSSSHPIMLLGSAKRGSSIAHEFYKLYLVKCRFENNSSDKLSITLSCVDYFNSTVEANIKVKDPVDARKKYSKKAPIKCKYNLCYELSINYEDPVGLIKKREFDPKPEFETDIKTYAERSEMNNIDKNFINEIKNNLADLTVRNYEAAYIKQILDIISSDRVKTYNDWRWIIYILAWTNPDYKVLAIWFSVRHPGSWSKGGDAQLNSNWNWAINHKNVNEDGKPEGRTINTIYGWAKEDNPEKYDKLQSKNAFMKLKTMLFDNAGQLNETHIAEVLYVMYGKKFICDENPFSTSKVSERRWYEFVFPTDDLGITRNSIYKWRLEKGKPDTLDKFISKKLPGNMEKIQEWIDNQILETDVNEDTLKYYELVKKNTKQTIFSLGRSDMIRRIISRCEVEFRTRGFEEKLDTCTDVIGIGNGVLKVYPQTEIIQRYHEIPITRSTNVDYDEPIQLPNISDCVKLLTSLKHDELNSIIVNQLLSTNNPHVKKIATEIRRLFTGEDDAFIKTMCYLSSSLDGRKKQPLFYIWLGEGQNGKSFLLEMHINTLHEVVKGGYGAKLNVAFFTQSNRKSGGPDSEKMMLKHARFAYCSESEPGETLQMSKIKEFTSETLSGNEKHQTQDMFEANCNFTFCSNNDPRVTGRDWGTWRRILVYIFKMKFVPNPDVNNPKEHKEDKSFSEIFPKSVEYKKAYLAILVYFYEIYRDLFNSNVNSIRSKYIEKDTTNYQNSQDTIAKFISEQIVHVAGKNVAKINLTDLAQKYVIWYNAKIDNIKIIKNDIINAFKTSVLRKYIVNKVSGHEYLTEHVVLDIGEQYQNNIDDEKPNNNVITEDEFNDDVNNINIDNNVNDDVSDDVSDDVNNEEKKINLTNLDIDDMSDMSIELENEQFEFMMK